MADKNIPFPQPIVADLGINPGPVQFDSSLALKEWIGIEFEAWSGLQNFQKYLKNFEPDTFAAVVQQLRHINALKKTVAELCLMGKESPRYEKQLELAKSHLELWKEVEVLHSKSKTGKYILKQFDGATETAVKLAACRDLSESILTKKSLIENASHTTQAKKKNEPIDEKIELADHLDEQLRKLGQEYRLLEDAAKKFREQITEIGITLESQKSSIDQLFEGTKGKLNNIKETYETGLATEAPVKYWTEKASHHSWLGAGLMGAFLVLAVGAGVAAYFGGSSLIELVANSSAELANSTGKTPDPTWGILARVTIFVLPAFLLVWILRIIARVGLVNLGLADDARERVAMTQSFLAFLSQEGKITEADKIVMLHSLFRPSALAGEDDAAPPNWFDLLANRLGKDS